MFIFNQKIQFQFPFSVFRFPFTRRINVFFIFLQESLMRLYNIGRGKPRPYTLFIQKQGEQRDHSNGGTNPRNF